MNIRCERCATLYELDESLLSPQGTPVQCTRCQHVFDAYPGKAPARAAGGAAPAAPRAEPQRPGEPHAAGEGDARRGVRSGGPAVYRPPSAPAPSTATPSVRRAPILRRDAVGAFESRLRWSHRLRWLVPAGALILALAVGAVALILRASGGPGREALRRRAEAMALVAQDDLASLARAEEALQALAAAEPELRSALADAALARVLRASSQDEEAVPSARALADRAREDLRRLEGEIGPDPAVRRASAVAHALAGEREAAVREARSLGEEGGFDRWVELSEALVEIEGDAAARTRGLARLQALVARSPELVRARYLLARAQAESGSRQEALASLEALLAVNPRHERARRFREALGSTGPQVEIARPPAPSDLPAPLAPAPAGAPGAPAAQAAAPAPAPAAGEPPPEVETQPAPSQPTAPVAPASLPVVVPPKPAPARTGQDGEGASEPGGGGDAATPRRGSGTRDHLLPDSGGG